MKQAALRYAEILEKGAWVTHQEQAEIAKLLRGLAMTEDEAWDDLEARIKRQNDAKQVADVSDLIFDAVALERTFCAEQYRKIMNDSIKRAILREREACAKLCDDASLYFIDQGMNAVDGADYCANEIKGRTK